MPDRRLGILAVSLLLWVLVLLVLAGCARGPGKMRAPASDGTAPREVLAPSCQAACVQLPDA